MNQHINAAAVIADLRQGALRLEAEALRIRSTIATLIDLYGDPDAQPDGYKPPPLYYPPERNPELRPASENAPEHAQAEEVLPGPSSAPNRPGKSARDADAAPPRRHGLSDDLRSLHRKHPDWTAIDIAEALNTTPAYVRKTAARLDLVLPHAKRGPRATKPAQEARKPAPAPKAPATPVPPVTAKPEPIAEAPRPVRPLPVANGPARRPSGKQFWLRNDAGEFLHRYCDRMTTDRREAWTGSQDQILGCRRTYGIARDLSERPVEKEQPAARGTM